MRTRAAVLRTPETEYEIVDVELLDPGPGEVQVEMAYAGLCHSDEHLRHSNPGGRYPIVGGHEGSGVVTAVGPGVTGVAPGDHVVTSFLPACGHCRFCAAGRSNLCDKGATIASGQLPSGTFPFRLDDEPLGGFCMIGAFAEHTLLSEFSCVKIDPWLPLDTAALVACSVPTGWGSAVYAGGVRPGDTVVVLGLGGVGASAVQGAVHAGAMNVVGVDPVALKREFAESIGASHTVADAEGAAGLARQIVMDQKKPIEERFRAQLKLAALPRNSAKTRIRNRCEITGRPRAYYRKLKMSRIALRDLGSSGAVPGLVKSSW